LSHRTFASRRQIISALIIITVGLVVACQSTAPAKPDVREYNLRGRVESIDLNKKRATIAHEEIDGYMKAMTMGFQIPDEQVLKSLKSGDRIEARLIYDSRTNLSWLENVRQTGTPAKDGSGN
jgi:Cu/Ag efflux protein CusF